MLESRPINYGNREQILILSLPLPGAENHRRPDFRPDYAPASSEHGPDELSGLKLDRPDFRPDYSQGNKAFEKGEHLGRFGV